MLIGFVSEQFLIQESWSFGSVQEIVPSLNDNTLKGVVEGKQKKKKKKKQKKRKVV